MSHPSLGLPPADQHLVHPGAMHAIQRAAPRLAARALTVAIDRDPTFRERYDEVGLRGRLNDAELLARRLALAVGRDDPAPMREYGEQATPIYRRKRVPLDDLIRLCEGLRAALPAVLFAEEELAAAGRGLDGAIDAFRWNRRLAGDARKRNRFLQFIYKGA